MPDKLLMFASTPSTVHSWLDLTPNRTFGSLKKAIEYAGKHVDDIRALEVLVKTEDRSYLIIWGDELALMIGKVCRH
jgi:hypothetical protein